MVFDLEPLTASRKRVRHEVYDIEAHNWTGFVLLGHYDGKNYTEFESLPEFLDFTFERKIMRPLFAHFGGKFDSAFILDCALKTRFFEYRPENMIMRGSSLYSFDLVRVKDKKSVKFMDSAALLPFGLKRLSNDFDVEHKKQEFDFSKWDGSITPKLREYLFDDCRALWEVLDRFWSNELIERAGHKTTIASQAVSVLRLYLNDPIPAIKEERIDKYVRECYFGGRTEIFKLLYYGTEQKPIRCYDVNSLYPFVMSEFEYPGKFDGFTRIYRPDKMGFWDAEVEVPEDMHIPPLPAIHPKSGKLVFPVGRFRGRWSTHELEYAKTLGVKVLSVEKGALFQNHGKIFEEMIADLYSRRDKAKKLGHTAEEQIMKLLMNSTYGKMGLNLDREEIVIDDGSEGLSFHSEISLVDNISVYLSTKEKRIEKSFSNVAIAAYVTSYARVHMHKLMWPIRDEVYYTDTDSIFTTARLPSSKKLGDLKLEYEAKDACFFLPKTYVIDGIEFETFVDGVKSKQHAKKVVMKGFEKWMRERFSFRDFSESLEGEVKLQIGKYQPDGIYTLKQAAARTKGVLARKIETSKAIKSRYDKRIIEPHKNFGTRPIFLGTDEENRVG